jgi:hypothetical protein
MGLIEIRFQTVWLKIIISYYMLMNQHSPIPGPKPPPAQRRDSQQNVKEESERQGELLLESQPPVTHAKVSNPIRRIENILNKPTAEVLQEAGVVATVAIEDSKTVGGLGLNLLTICALVAASPWSWIAALIFGPMRVWNFFYVAVTGGIGQVLALVAVLLVLLVLSVFLVIGWLIAKYGT